MDHHEIYEQKIAYARASLWAPFYAVGMVAHIKGNVPTGLLESTLCKLGRLYPPLASRVRMEKDGSAWLTTEGVGKFPLDVRPMISEEEWEQVFLEQERLPFAFDRGPLARFFLLRGDQYSDLIAIVPHVICDGYAMTHVMADAVALLNDPGRVVTLPLPPPAVTWETMPHAATDDLLLRGFVRVLNRIWPDSREVLQQRRYEDLHQCYWERKHNGLLAFELSAAETSDLVARCRQRGVNVTGALVAAFLLAQADVQHATKSNRCEVAVAVNVRDRMLQPPNGAIGVYASSFDMRVRLNPGIGFWELARQGHKRIHKGLEDRPLILRPLVLEELDPAIADALVTAVSTDRWPREFGLLTPFIRLKGRVRWLTVSNIGRINLPDVGEPYRLENLLPFPPLPPGGGIALNALTVNGRMNLILKFQQEELPAVAKIKDRALSYLLCA